MARPSALCLALLLAHASASEQPRPPFWPTKNGNSHRTGQAEHTAPFNLSVPTWVWEEPDRPRTHPMEAMHTSPMLDADKNVYITTVLGRAFMLNEHGKTLWRYDSTGGNLGNLALHDGTLFSAADDGFAFALEAGTGRELWRTSIGAGAPSDTYSPLVMQGIVVLPACSQHQTPADIDGNDRVVALNVEDGSVRWRFEMPSGVRGYNLMPAEFEDSVVFPDRAGGLYRLLIANGSQVWSVPPPNPSSVTTGGLALGPNGAAYVASSNTTAPNLPGSGFLIAYNLSDSAQLWREVLEDPLNVAPAVGMVAGHDALAVVVAVGADPMVPGITGSEVKGSVEARDALTGELLWVFHPGVSDSSGCAGWKIDDQCYPDIFGNPSIGADGTVYVNWSGGWSYALKDVNGDGVVDSSDPTEVSKFFHNEGTNGQSAIAPGLLIAPTCWKLFGFVDVEPPVPPGNKTPLIVGVTCAIVAVLLVAAAACYCRCRKDHRTEAEESFREASLQPRG